MASEHRRNVSDDILQGALDKAFSPPPSRRQSVRIPSPGAKNELAEPPVQPTAEEPPAESEPAVEPWKVEYEAQVETWRSQASEAREKAEKERERWEALRAAEREDPSRREAVGIVTDTVQQDHDATWETVSHKKDHLTMESTPAPESSPLLGAAESEIPVAGHTSAQSAEPASSLTSATQSQRATRSHSQADTADESQKWENIQSSMTSSLPSMTFPERTESPPPPSRPSGPNHSAPLSTTLSVFDSTLSTRTRVTAFCSSLAINLLLPFVNGVMLGFGEIFAKNIVMGWLGWKPAGPGFVAATTGINGTPWNQQVKQKRP